MEEALLTLLLNSPAGTIVSGRIHWSRRAEKALPAISLHRISGRHDHHMQGRTGLVESTVQTDCWGRSYAEAKTLARAVIAALPQVATAIGEVTLQGAFIDGESDSFEDGTTPVFRTRIDFSLWHRS